MRSQIAPFILFSLLLFFFVVGLSCSSARNVCRASTYTSPSILMYSCTTPLLSAPIGTVLYLSPFILAKGVPNNQDVLAPPCAPLQVTTYLASTRSADGLLPVILVCHRPDVFLHVLTHAPVYAVSCF